MKRILITSFITVILSASLLFANNDTYSQEPYSYFIYNEDSLSQDQLSQIIKLKTEYQNKISELREKMYLEKVKMNLEMSNPNTEAVNNSINLNRKYSKELKKIANEFLEKYKQIKANK